MRALSAAVLLWAVCWLAMAHEWGLAVALCVAGGCLFVSERR